MTYEFPHGLLIQFAKAPELGKVKTRMQPQLTTEQSLSLHCQLVKRTYHTLVHSAVAALELWTSGSDSFEFFQDLEPRAILREQLGSDLGLRMHHALSDGLDRYEAVVLVGSDCPFLSPEVLREAFKLLGTGKDCVLGPATDGGYVLIGLTRNSVELFTDIDWGTDEVLAQTCSRLHQLEWQWAELAPLADIDTPEDLNLITCLKEYYV
ncbi:MAG: TIGR04282 family arsenosugar biosynthesis glycosyltransferase [Porticoccaceae bacterium]|nr:TIGR04282 family arsenosugar biosynthesis glycosyltransferase [Porticoccaceae bacterium]